jgi:3-oxoacyl-[acyl-carrier protein] reductase
MRHHERIALVTGAGRGIGFAIARRLAEEGADIVCTDRTDDLAEAGAARLRETGRRVLAVGMDVSDSAAVANAFEKVAGEFGAPVILVNNAGITRDQLLLRMKDEDWDIVLDVNLKGAFLCIREAARGMMRARFGRIVNVSSIVGLGGAVAQANYAASKAGLIGLTKTVAKEFGSRGITCNAVAPGFIQTEMTESLPEEFRKWAIETAPAKRLGTVEDVAGTVSFLCSDEAAFVTGQTLVVDGGLTL